MIVDKFVNIKIVKNNLKRINKDLNSNHILNDIVSYPIALLSKYSNLKIKVKCDKCGKENTISMASYTNSFEKYNIYTCSGKCSVFKREQTLMKLYGVSNSMFSKKIKNKLKETVLKLYGCENVFQNNDIKIKMKKTNIKKIGVEYPSQSKKIREKSINSYMTRYGVEHPMQSKEIRQKSINTCLKNHRVENPSQSKEIMSRMIKSRGENRRYDLSDFKKYQYQVIQSTLKNKTVLFKEWNGLDYYDNDYIKENFNLKPTDKNYPTIDHKFSVFYCFHNNISIEDASKIENLCITKKCINSRKNRKNEDNFNNS